MFHAHTFENSFRLVLEDKRLMSKGLEISFMIKLLELLRIWVVFSAIGISLPWKTVLIIWSFTLMLLMVPWLPGSLGLFEFGTSSAFILLGIAAPQAAGGVILDRFVSFWFVIFFSLAIIWISKKRLGEIMRLSEKG
ncbi:MAG: flippase-like domain-containing protein [Candidatus Aenigmarchaeota archaeon]|nr:flippase-like domain-containing protein [Candidatus Aenigmarchaeota archaeon]MDI6722487.1 flippase-like domain-containing protein [Candidatus Aenigmarchaeota archaeon]